MDRSMFIAGSAHLDIISHISDERSVLDKNGTITISFGGGALNMAINMAVMNFPVVYMGAFKLGAISQMVLSEMSAQGVRLHVQHVPDMPDAAVNLFLKGDDVVNSVVSLPITTYDFDVDFIARGMTHAACAVLNATLSIPSLNRAIRVANGAQIPVFLAGVSENQALKIPHLEGRIEQIFLNRREMNHVMAHEGIDSPAAFAERLHTTCVVTNGREPVEVWTHTGEHVSLPVPPLKGEGTKLGAGDFLMAHTVALQVYRGQSLLQALSATLPQMDLILKTPHANLGQYSKRCEPRPYGPPDAGIESGRVVGCL